MTKPARTDHPIHELLAMRYSPYAFTDRAVSLEDLRSLFEAARWAPSCYNEQPWRYIVATRERGGEFERVLSCLVEGNQGWARRAPVLALGVVSVQFERNGKPNDVARHDLGLATAQLTLEATARRLHVHQMRGILPDKAREEFAIPGGFEAVTGIAIGYAADPATLDDRLRARETAPRERRPLRAFVFAGTFGMAADLGG
jgi:nitroreductase